MANILNYMSNNNIKNKNLEKNINIKGKNTFLCEECGTRYHISGDNPPPSPKWDDGHICKMIKIN